MDFNSLLHGLLPVVVVLMMGVDKIVHTYITAKKGVDHNVWFDAAVKAAAAANSLANPTEQDTAPSGASATP